MPTGEIDGAPIWYEEHGDPDGPPLVALHGGVLTFEGSFGDVLPWLTPGRRVIGVELQGQGHTPETGRPMPLNRLPAGPCRSTGSPTTSPSCSTASGSTGPTCGASASVP